MIAGTLVLSLLTVAFAHPPYAEYALDMANAINQLSDQILSMEGNIPDMAVASRHYAVLITHIGLVADQVATNCSIDYEKVYMDTLAESIAEGLMDVTSVIEVTKNVIQTVDADTQKIQKLKKRLCLETTTNEVCNQLMDQAVSGDSQRYKHEADIFLTAGEASKTLLSLILPWVSDKYDEIGYLLKNIDELSYLIGVLANLIRLDQNKEPCELPIY